MSACERLLRVPAGTALGGTDIRDAQSRIDALPVSDLLLAWRELQTTGWPALSGAARAFASNFDGLGMNATRCVDFIERLVADEPDDRIVARAAQDKLIFQLIHHRAAEVIDRLEDIAERLPRLRRLLGRAYWGIGGIEDEALLHRLRALCDRKGFEAWAADNIGADIDVAGMPLKQVAGLWVRYYSASPIEQDRMGWFDLSDFDKDDPERLLGLIEEILAATDDPMLLSFLAAGPLEDIVPEHVTPFLDQLTAAAARDPRLARLLREGVWYHGVDEAVLARLREVVSP